MATTLSPKATDKYFTFQFALLCVSNFLFSGSFSMMLPELSGYITKLGGADYKGYIIALFTLMAGISRPFSGKLTDTIGRVPVMIFGSLVCVVCSLLYPLLTTVAGFLFLRFIHGFSTGFKPTATSAYGADVVHESRRGEALGALAVGYTLGMSVGPMVGSFMVANYSYNAMFYLSAAFALGSVIILVNIKETLAAPQKFAREFITIKKHEVFENSAIKPALIMLLVAFSSGCTLTIVPDLSEWIGITYKGLFFACYTISSLLIRLAANKASDRHGRIIVMVYAAGALVVSMALLSFAHTPVMFIISAAIFGLSWGMNGPTLTAWAVDLCAVENRGRAVASVYIALEAGIGLGALVSAHIYDNNPANFVYTFIIPGILSFIAMILLLSWKSKPVKPAI